VFASGGGDGAWKLWNSRLLLQFEEFGKRIEPDIHLSIPVQKVYGYEGTIVSGFLFPIFITQRFS
jgi:hypothetical protein